MLSLLWILPYRSSRMSLSKQMCYVNSSDNHLHLQVTDEQILSSPPSPRPQGRAPGSTGCPAAAGLPRRAEGKAEAQRPA